MTKKKNDIPITVAAVVWAFFLCFIPASAVESSNEEMIIGKAVSIKGETLFIAPLGMVELWGVQLPDEVLVADRELALQALNRRIHGEHVLIIEHVAQNEMRTIEIISENGNVNKYLIDEGYVFANENALFYDFDAYLRELDAAFGDEIVQWVGGVRIDPTPNPIPKPIYADEMAEPESYQQRNIPLWQWQNKSAPPYAVVASSDGKETPLSTGELQSQSLSYHNSSTLSSESSSIPPLVIRSQGDLEIPQFVPGMEVPDHAVVPAPLPKKNRDQDLAIYHFRRGRGFHEQNRLSEARAEYILALNYNPILPDVNFYLDQTYSDKADIDQAKRFYQRVKQKASENSLDQFSAEELAMEEVKTTAIDNRKTQSASVSPPVPPLPTMAEVTAVPPDKRTGLAKSHYQQGIAFVEQGRIEEARQQFLTALKYRPTFADAKYRLTLTYLEKTDGRKKMDDPAQIKKLAAPLPQYNPVETQETAPDQKSIVQVKKLFEQAYRESDLEKMRRLTRNYRDLMSQLFDSYLTALRSGVSSDQADSLKKKARIIANLFIIEYHDESFIEQLKEWE